MRTRTQSTILQLLLIALLTSTGGGAGKPATTKAAPSSQAASVAAALERRLAEPAKSPLAAAAAAGRKRVLVVVQPAADGEADRRRLLDDVRAALVHSVKAAGLQAVASPEADAQLRRLNPKAAALQPAALKSMRDALKSDANAAGCTALLHAVYTRRGDARSVRLSVLDDTASLGAALVAIDRADLAALPPPSFEEVGAAERAVGEAVKASLAEPARAAAIKGAYAKVAVAVSSSPAKSADALHLAALVRGHLAASLSLRDDAPAATEFDFSPETESALAGRKRGATFTPAEAARVLAGSPHAAILSVACTRVPGRANIDVALVDPKQVAWKTTLALDDWDVAAIPPVPLMNQRVLEFAKRNLGKKVGDGDCWTLVADAVEAGGVRRPNDYTFGRELHEGEPILPGDVLQFDSVVLRNRKMQLNLGMPHHTAIVSESAGDKTYKILHQNHGGDEKGKVVQALTINLADLKSGTIKIFRPQPGKT